MVARRLVFARRQRNAQVTWQVDWGFPIGAGLRSIPGPFDFSGVRSHGKTLKPLPSTRPPGLVQTLPCSVPHARLSWPG